MLRIGLLIFCFHLIGFVGTAQSKMEAYNGDDKYLRTCLRWNDSTIYSTLYHGKRKLPVYSFEIQKLCHGRYESKQIFIATTVESLYQFNPTLELGVYFWWTLTKSNQCEGEDFIYYHRGGF
jgi:hypothetical protein